jgi:hypothetical protein
MIRIAFRVSVHVSANGDIRLSMRKPSRRPFLTQARPYRCGANSQVPCSHLNCDQDLVVLRSLAFQVDVTCPAEALKAEA